MEYSPCGQCVADEYRRGRDSKVHMALGRSVPVPTQRSAARCGVRCRALPIDSCAGGPLSLGWTGGLARTHAPAVEAAAVDVRDVRQPVLYGAHPWQLGVARLVRPRGRSRRGRASRQMHGTERWASRALRQRPTWNKKSKPPGPVGLSTRITSSAIRLHSSHFSFGTCEYSSAYPRSTVSVCG